VEREFTKMRACSCRCCSITGSEIMEIKFADAGRSSFNIIPIGVAGFMEAKAAKAGEGKGVMSLFLSSLVLRSV
jgi:hypothetical protein